MDGCGTKIHTRRFKVWRSTSTEDVLLHKESVSSFNK